MKSFLAPTAASVLFLVAGSSQSYAQAPAGGGYYRVAPPPYPHYRYQTSLPPIQTQSRNVVTYTQPRSVQPQQRQLRWWELHVHYPDSSTGGDFKSGWHTKPWSETAPE